jgi:hypothetical protein
MARPFSRRDAGTRVSNAFNNGVQMQTLGRLYWQVRHIAARRSDSLFSTICPPLSMNLMAAPVKAMILSGLRENV